MNISVFDMYRIGIGPSSSHTVGPMRAGRNFISLLRSQHLFPEVEGIKVKLMGSLAATGIGHATDSAVLLGLMGKSPSVIDVDSIPDWIKDIKDKNRLLLDSCKPISFTYSKDLTFEPSVLDSYHTNTLIISAFDAKGSELFSRKYYSVGGGFIETEEEAKLKQEPRALPATEEDKKALPYPFSTANELMKQCRKNGLSMEAVIRANEEVIRSHEVIDDTLDHIWSVMSMCIDRGLNAKGCLPGPLKVKRKEGIRTFLLVAGAIGALYKKNASISGAEVGCQGEVGVACSMAAAGLAAALGATNEQIENAAEIGMEHHLGLTCDPVRGQVQIPCIERNGIAAVKAVNSVRLAMMGDGSHYVSLDQVIETMMQTGKDMANKYKETSLGGLAVCVVEC